MAKAARMTLPAGQLAVLEAAYASPPRAYHSFQHVQEVLRQHADVDSGPGWLQPVETYLAMLYHDAIYEAGRSDNEARSAQLAIAEIARWLPEADIDAARVAALIELTARHGQFSPDDFGDGVSAADTRHFLDCDMAILGADPAVFDAYDRGIAAEYRGKVPGWIFKLQRRRFLKALLARPRIYLSDLFHDRYDLQARANLRRAINEKR